MGFDHHFTKGRIFNILSIVVIALAFIPTAILLLVALIGEMSIWIPLGIGIGAAVIALALKIIGLAVDMKGM